MKAGDSALDFEPSDDPIAAGAIGEENGLKDDVLDLVSWRIRPRERVRKQWGEANGLEKVKCYAANNFISGNCLEAGAIK